ncbi:MAG: rRNA maturation RNase YbeY [Pseudomonadota bacterium]
MAIDVQFAVEIEEPPAADLVKAAEAVMRRLRKQARETEVCLRIVDTDESRYLNETYRGKDKATNVLSFPADIALPEGETRILGDIAICDSVVRAEAEAQRKPLEAHYAHMVVHGMLHLYGYDHEDPKDADAMEDIEREVLGRLGFADPYGES